MRKQTQERVSAGFANVGARLDALWSIQPHRWNLMYLNDTDIAIVQARAILIC